MVTKGLVASFKGMRGIGYLPEGYALRKSDFGNFCRMKVIRKRMRCIYEKNYPNAEIKVEVKIGINIMRAPRSVAEPEGTPGKYPRNGKDCCRKMMLFPIALF